MSSTPYRALARFCSLVNGNVLSVGDVSSSDHSVVISGVSNLTTISLESGADIVSDYNEYKFKKKFDGIWCAHCLEHQRSVGVFLDKIFSDLKDGGILCITVPPRKDKIVGGHLSLWNGGLLLYNLILAGFDCSGAEVLKDGYNISVIVRKKAAKIPDLKMDCGDIEALSHFFPFPAEHGFDGNIEKIGFENDYL